MTSYIIQLSSIDDVAAQAGNVVTALRWRRAAPRSRALMTSPTSVAGMLQLDTLLTDSTIDAERHVVCHAGAQRAPSSPSVARRRLVPPA